MSTYTIVGINLQEIAKSMLYDYFKAFGALSDHIVRLKTGAPFAEDSSPTGELASFTIHYRALDQGEQALVGHPHVVGGVQISCYKQGAEGAVAERKIFIKYLDKKATAEDIRESMAKYGEVEAVHISMKKDKSMNLGLGNVLFKNKDAVERVLNDPSVIIRSKKVKVEQFKCSSSGSKTPSVYHTNSLKQRGQNPLQTWSEPILQNNRSSKPSHYSPYGIPTIKSKTAISVLDMQSLQDSDQEVEKPPLRVTISPPSLPGLSIKSTCRDAKDSAMLDLSTKNGDATGQHGDLVKSLDFSFIEEECEESPRPRRGSEKCHLSPRALYDEKERYPQCPIICIHGDINEPQSIPLNQKGSFHSVKPTSKTYYKNPRHHLVPLAKNHKESNLRLNRRFRNVARALLPSAVTTNMIDVPRFRLF